MIMVIVYFFLDKHYLEPIRVLNNEKAQLINLKQPLKILRDLPSIFWLFNLSWIFQSSVLGTFNTISADLVRQHFHTTTRTSAYVSSITEIIPIFMTPLVGLFIDRVGCRPQIIPVS